MTITALISVIGHMMVAVLCNYHILLPILYSLSLQQAGELVVFLYLAEWPRSSFLKGLGHYWSCLHWDECSFPSTLITGHGSIKKCPERSPVLPAYSSYLRCGVLVEFALGVRTNHPASTVNSLLCLLIQNTEELKVPASSLNFRPNGIIVVSSGGSIPPSAAKTSRPVEHRHGNRKRKFC